MIGNACGWPLNVVMTPEKKPFFVATYLPKESRFGRIGMLDLLPRIARLWRERRDEVEASAEEITAALRQTTRPLEENVEMDGGLAPDRLSPAHPAVRRTAWRLRPGSEVSLAPHPALPPPLLEAHG
ncbi:MAG: hypothetical protein KatS3mg043_1810 [Rhodothermaceae bacterium]|nr:MAG: hypothetical protein KatS3mg043_1810 [Rhodothermaceae bacterium]